jgi:carboxypeptidase family protein/TonB-dependent receptor-like protein
MQRAAMVVVGFVLLHEPRPDQLLGQGVTTAAVQGSVSQADGTPIEAAVVEARNTVTGQVWRFETRSHGRFFFENMAVGGPYVVEARAVGFRPARMDGIRLTLGQRYTADFSLAPAALELPSILVRGADSLANAARTGPAQRIPDSAIARLPNPVLGRNAFNLALLSPQAGTSLYGDLSISGQNPVYNSFQVDGGLNSSLYSSGPAGQGFLPFPISQEAIQELQVLAAPFDVRQGSFAGGLLTAVTKSGGNEWHGTAFGYLQNQSFVGADSAGTPAPDFTSWQYGGALSGPIVRDRVHFFVNADLQHLVTPDNGPFITDTAGGRDTLTYGVSAAEAVRFRDVLAQQYGLSPGTLGRVDDRFPASDLFGKVTAQPGPNDRLELSIHRAHSNHQFTGIHDPAIGYGLGSLALQEEWTEHVGRLIWHTLIGDRWANEVILSYLDGEYRQPDRSAPFIQLFTAKGNVAAGSLPPPDATPFLVRTNAFEVTDNATVDLGRHLVTVGTHNEFLRFRDNNFTGSGGLWFFTSLDSLEQGLPDSYFRIVPGPLRPDGPNVDFRVRQIGVYAQDQWSATPRLTLTGGLRVDVPFLPDPSVSNPDVLATFGYDTGKLPSGHPLWSPRLGINYDVRGDGRTYLRGGIGLFSGSPAYRWIANGYRDSGGEQGLIFCQGTEAPAFAPLHPPAMCASGASADVEPRITVFEPGFRFPQNLKLALGVDQRLPWNLLASADLLFTRWNHQLYFDDLNLGPPVGTAAGEGGRALYGTIDSLGTPTTARRSGEFGPVVRVSNRSGDRALSASVQLQRSFGSGLAFTTSYTYTSAEDRFSLVNYFAGFNLAHTPVDGTLADRRRGNSVFESPHRVVAAGSVDLPLGARLGLFYTGATQSPYTYVVDGDVNADGLNSAGNQTGIAGNDVVYVPRDVRPGGDVSLVVEDETGTLVDAPDSVYAALDQFIQQQGCLRAQRGQLLRRNSCRNGWLSQVNVRLSKAVTVGAGHALEITADLFNLLNRLDGGWGRYRTTSPEPELPMLRLRGYDAARGRGRYELALPPRRQLRDFESRWRMQLSLRYTF